MPRILLNQWLTIALVGVLSGCQRDLLHGLEDRAKLSFDGCHSDQRELEELCIKQRIYRNGLVSGEQGAKVCARMKDVAAADGCWEAVVMLDPPYAPDDSCDNIEQDRIRASCMLSLADRLGQQLQSPDKIVPACFASAPNTDECFYHFAMWRLSYYEQNGGVDTLRADMAYMIEKWPEVTEYSGFGRGMASAYSSIWMNGPMDQPCVLLPQGTKAYQGCWSARQSRDYWTYVNGARVQGNVNSGRANILQDQRRNQNLNTP